MDFGTFRSIEGDTILSPSLPRLAVRIGPDFVYLGKLYYIAANTYHVEQFIFLDPNSLGLVTRVMLVQFAGFLGNKEGAYNYSHQKTVQVNDEAFFYEEKQVHIDDYVRRFPNSDLGHAADYIRQRSYTLAGDMNSHRFTRLVSPDARSEFAIIYLEGSPEGSTPGSTLSIDGSQTPQPHVLNCFSIVPYDSVVSE